METFFTYFKDFKEIYYEEIFLFCRFSCLEKLEEGDLTTAENVLKLEEKESLAFNSQLPIASDQEMLFQNEDDEIQIEEFED